MADFPRELLRLMTRLPRRPADARLKFLADRFGKTPDERAALLKGMRAFFSSGGPSGGQRSPRQRAADQTPPPSSSPGMLTARNLSVTGRQPRAGTPGHHLQTSGERAGQEATNAVLAVKRLLGRSLPPGTVVANASLTARNLLRAARRGDPVARGLLGGAGYDATLRRLEAMKVGNVDHDRVVENFLQQIKTARGQYVSLPRGPEQVRPSSGSGTGVPTFPMSAADRAAVQQGMRAPAPLSRQQAADSARVRPESRGPAPAAGGVYGPGLNRALGYVFPTGKYRGRTIDEVLQYVGGRWKNLPYLIWYLGRKGTFERHPEFYKALYNVIEGTGDAGRAFFEDHGRMSPADLRGPSGNAVRMDRPRQEGFAVSDLYARPPAVSLLELGYYAGRFRDTDPGLHEMMRKHFAGVHVNPEAAHARGHDVRGRFKRDRRSDPFDTMNANQVWMGRAIDFAAGGPGHSLRQRVFEKALADFGVDKEIYSRPHNAALRGAVDRVVQARINADEDLKARLGGAAMFREVYGAHLRAYGEAQAKANLLFQHEKRFVPLTAEGAGVGAGDSSYDFADPNADFGVPRARSKRMRKKDRAPDYQTRIAGASTIGELALIRSELVGTYGLASFHLAEDEGPQRQTMGLLQQRAAGMDPRTGALWEKEFSEAAKSLKLKVNALPGRGAR